MVTGFSFLALAALAKLTAGRTLAEAKRFGSFGEPGVGGVLMMEVVGGGVLVRSDAVRELVRDIGCEANRSFVTSRSFSRRSATSLSRDDTSTGLFPVKPATKKNIACYIPCITEWIRA